MNKIKVLQITDSLNVGGTEVLAVNIANSFVNYEVESHICSTREKGFLVDKINENVSYFFLNKKVSLDLVALFRLKAYIKKYKINIIHAHSTSLFFACFLKLLCPRIKLFWHNHTGANYKLQGSKLIVLKVLTRLTNGIINVNNDLNQWSIKKLKHQRTIKLNNFPVFIDLNCNTELKGEKNKRIVCLAALRTEKDHINLLKAFKKVVEIKKDWSLHLIGKDYNNEYSKSIKDYININNLKNNVFIYGMRSDIKNILNQSTIGVLSSITEGLPISLLEYGLAKLPVLTTDVGECKNVIGHKKAVVCTNNSEAFAELLLEIINSDKLKDEILNSLHENVLKNYSSKNFIGNLLKFYQNNDK